MSFWINRLQCDVCGSEINVQGGMVGHTWMGPSTIECPNIECRAQGSDNFTTIAYNIDFATQPQYRGFTIRGNHNQDMESQDDD